MAEQDLARIKRNVAKMAEQGAPEDDIDGYIASEGTTVDVIRAFKPNSAQPQQERTTYQKVVESNPLTQGLVGLGAGLTKAAVGAVQAGAQAVGADRVAEAAGRVTQDINRDLQPDRLGTAGKAGSFVGEVGPYLALPAGAGSLKGIAALGALGGGLQGALSAQEEPSLGDRAIDTAVGAGIGAVAPVALSGLSKGASKIVEGIKAPKPVNVAGDVLGSVDVVGNAKAVQDILRGQHQIASGAERAAWNQVQAQAAGKSVRLGEIPKIQQVLMDAQAESGAPILDTQLRTLNRFVDGDLPVPAETLVRMRQALSKASVKDGGLRSAVKGLDDIIEKTIDAKSLPQALSASRERFGKFVDQEAVAKAIADDATPETVGKLLMKNATQGADIFEQVAKASGKEAEAAKKAMQQGIAHNILSEGVVTYNKAGDAVINKSGLADNIFQLRTANKSLWNKLTPKQQEGLLVLAQNVKKSAEGNKALNLARVVMDFMGPKVSVVNRVTGVSEKLSPSQQMTLDEALKLMKVKPPK